MEAGAGVIAQWDHPTRGKVEWAKEALRDGDVVVPLDLAADDERDGRRLGSTGVSSGLSSRLATLTRTSFF